jgi:hypothetical protein
VAPAAHGMQSCFGYAVCEEPAVDQRHDRVVISGENQGWLAQLPQPRHARPSCDGVELSEVARHRGPFDKPGQRAVQECVRVAARLAADSGTGRGKDESADTLRSLVGELLGHDAAQGHAEHVDLVLAEPVEHPFHGPGDARHPPRLPAACGQLPLERLSQVEAGPEAGDQQQRPAGAAHRGAQPDGTRVDEPDSGWFMRRRRRR